MTGIERRSVFSLAFLYATRMLGLFMVLPVFVIYGQELEGATDLLIGFAIGAYGLSQALFQIPFGALSDRYGRKKLIAIGLFLFFVGSVFAAAADSIYGVILGRFLQGSGAIASVLMALLSDLTSEQSRTKAMAMVGMSIGVSFSVALVIGPVIAQWSGLAGIFWVTAVLALFGMVWLVTFVPTPVQSFKNRDTRVFKDQFYEVIKNKELLRLDLGIFILHMSLTAMFIAVPYSLLEQVQMPASDHWWVYLTVMLLSFFAMVPFIIVGEKKRKMKSVFIFAIGLLGLASLSAQWTDGWFVGFWFSLFFFFMAFNLLEASLPSLVSKLSPAGSKGTAMGLYSTSQFMGAFVGGVAGGVIMSLYDLAGVYTFVSLSAFVWCIAAYSMGNPSAETGMTLSFEKSYDARQAQEILSLFGGVKGVEEVVAIPGENLAYLKVVKAELDLVELDRLKLKFDGA